MENQSPLILASASPRRRELLSVLGIPLEVIPSTADERLPAGLDVAAALEQVALRKATEVADRVGRSRWILAADTAVVLEGRVHGKPRDRHDVIRTLRLLSDRAHSVITAVALIGPSWRRSFSVETAVTFRALSEPEIHWYASLAEPYDKAGAYAIQGSGAFLVASIRGSYTNVVGLPMSETVDLLEAARILEWSTEGLREAAGA